MLTIYSDFMKYATIIDIAKELGISKSTVSRALRGDSQNVSRETQKRILEVAERLVCGELGADTELTERFLQMGLDELSVSPGCILPVRKAIREAE